MSESERSQLVESVTLLHRQAMEQADCAIAAKLKGDLRAANHYFREAFRMESEAAALLEGKANVEPTRSVLLRSAAALARNGGL